MTVAFLAETIGQLDQQLNTLLSLLRRRETEPMWSSRTCMQRSTQGFCAHIREPNLGCDVEFLMFFQQLLRVMDTRACGCVCGQVKLPGVVNPLQSLKNTQRMFVISRVCRCVAVKLQRALCVPVWRSVQTPRTAGTDPACVSSSSRSGERGSLFAVAH